MAANAKPSPSKSNENLNLQLDHSSTYDHDEIGEEYESEYEEQSEEVNMNLNDRKTESGEELADGDYILSPSETIEWSSYHKYNFGASSSGKWSDLILGGESSTSIPKSSPLNRKPIKKSSPVEEESGSEDESDEEERPTDPFNDSSVLNAIEKVVEKGAPQLMNGNQIEEKKAEEIVRREVK